MTSSRFRQIADDLHERVALGEFGDQGALDSESALCARYTVSRVTVRRALETLREQGLVESRQGSGWFATGGSFHQTLALGTFRHAGSAVAESGKAMTRRVVEFGFRQASPALASTLDLVADADPDAADPDADAANADKTDAAKVAESEALHSRSVRTVDGVPLDLVAEWVPAAIARRLSRADAADPGIWASLQRDGHRVASVRQTITAGIASADDAALLDVTIGAPLLLIRRLALDEHKQPLALSDHRYLAHRFSLEVEFNGWPVAGADTPPGLRERPAQAPGIPTDPKENRS
ncbi:MAG: GntR family transcriptional regulator [Dermatophilaceae bacterium]